MIDLILAFMFGWFWGSKEEEKKEKFDNLVHYSEEDMERFNIITEDGQEFGYYKNKDENLS